MWDEVGRRAPGRLRAGILVVEKLVPASGTPAAEALLSFKQDPAFGPVLVFGLGGLLTEWYGALAPNNTTVILRPGEVKQGLQAAVKKFPALKIFFEGKEGTRRRPSCSTTWWPCCRITFLRIFLFLSPPRTLSEIRLSKSWK